MELNEILAFSQLVINKTEEERKQLAMQIGIDYDEYRQRIVGKEKEAEFIIILKSLGCLKHLEAYDEGVSHITEEYTPDLYVELVDGYKMLIEIKYTSKDYFKISSGNLERRIEFAKHHELPLRFAVFLNGFWGLFTTEDLINKNGKLVISDFAGEKSSSWLDVELATCAYMLPFKPKIRSVYMKNPDKKATGIFHGEYGELVSYEFYANDRKIFRLKGNSSPYKLHSIYLEALQDQLSTWNQIVEKHEETTIVTEYSEEKENICIIPEYKFLIAPIKHVLYGTKNGVEKYDWMRAIADKNFQYLDVRVLRAIMIDLAENGLEIITFRDSKGYRIQDFKEVFWTRE